MARTKLPNWIEFKLMFAFPDAEINEEAGKITMNALDVMRLLDRLDYLERPASSSPKREEPPKFMNYREGGWMRPEPF